MRAGTRHESAGWGAAVGESHYWEKDTHMSNKIRQTHINTVTGMHADKATPRQTHTHWHSCSGCCQMDSGQGQWSCWVIFYFSFTMSCPHSLPPTSASRSAAVLQWTPVRFTFKCLHLAPRSTFFFRLASAFFQPFPWHTVSRPRPTRLLSPNEWWLSF